MAITMRFPARLDAGLRRAARFRGVPIAALLREAATAMVAFVDEEIRCARQIRAADGDRVGGRWSRTPLRAYLLDVREEEEEEDRRREPEPVVQQTVINVPPPLGLDQLAVKWVAAAGDAAEEQRRVDAIVAITIATTSPEEAERIAARLDVELAKAKAARGPRPSGSGWLTRRAG